jgi:hypothetical protein
MIIEIIAAFKVEDYPEYNVTLLLYKYRTDTLSYVYVINNDEPIIKDTPNTTILFGYNYYVSIVPYKAGPLQTLDFILNFSSINGIFSFYLYWTIDPSIIVTANNLSRIL